MKYPRLGRGIFITSKKKGCREETPAAIQSVFLLPAYPSDIVSSRSLKCSAVRGMAACWKIPKLILIQYISFLRDGQDQLSAGCAPRYEVSQNQLLYAKYAYGCLNCPLFYETDIDPLIERNFDAEQCHPVYEKRICMLL